MKFYCFFALLVVSLFTGCSLGKTTKKKEPRFPKRLIKVMQQKNMELSAPLVLRIFKQEAILEVWKKTRVESYDLLISYDICKYSGGLGPKLQEGDRQAPEGFYHVNLAQLNPNSLYHFSFNIGFPNFFDQAHGRTGSNLMVHGGCSSSGCYAMTNKNIEEIYALILHSLRHGQKKVQIQAFPFRMTKENMLRYQTDFNIDFWKNLKEGYDHFERTKNPPEVRLCEKNYVFNQKQQKEDNFLLAQSNSCSVGASLEQAFTTRQEKQELILINLPSEAAYPEKRPVLLSR